jgi:hypothetical protein
MRVIFGNEEECSLPWANGYRLGSIQWNREMIDHDINVEIMYPELTPPTLPFEHLPLSTDPRNLPESALSGRMTIPIRWTSNSNQVIITEGNPQTISFQQGMIAQTIEIQWAADHEHFRDTGSLTFESIDLQNTQVDFIGYKDAQSHPEMHLCNNNSRILRIPIDFQTDIWHRMNAWKGNDILRNSRITLELEDGTTTRGDYQIERSKFEFEFSMPEWVKLLQDGREEDYTHKVTLRITNRNQTKSFTVTDIEIDQHEVFHTIPMLDGWFRDDSVHYTEALDGINGLDFFFQLEEVGRFDMNLIRYRVTTNFDDSKPLLAGEFIKNEVRRIEDRTLNKKIFLPPLPAAFGQYELTITPELSYGDTDRWVALTNFSNHVSLEVKYPRQPNFTWGNLDMNWRTLMRAGNLNKSTVHNELSGLPGFPEDNGMKTQMFFREKSNPFEITPVNCEGPVNPEDWITEWVIVNPLRGYRYPGNSAERSLYMDRKRVILASIFIPNSHCEEWVITKPVINRGNTSHSNEYGFMNGRKNVETSIVACEKTGLHLLVFAPENSLEWDDEGMTYQNLIELLENSEINDFDFNYGFVEVIPKED